jgi:hypothetical protein
MIRIAVVPTAAAVAASAYLSGPYRYYHGPAYYGLAPVYDGAPVYPGIGYRF